MIRDMLTVSKKYNSETFSSDKKIDHDCKDNCFFVMMELGYLMR